MSYWTDRAAARQAVYDRASAQVGSIITDAHKRMLMDLRDDAKRIIGNFEKAFDLTPTEAQALLKSPMPAKELARLQARIDEITDPAYKKAMQAKISSGAYAHRLNRLEGIQMSAETAAIKVADVEKTVGLQHLENTIYQGYGSAMFDIQQYTGIGFSFSGVDERRVKQILRNEWSGKSFSRRVWLNNEEMARQLSRALVERVMQGKTTRETFQALSDLSDMGRMAANRLLSTETNYIANQATAEAYDDAGIERYKFISVLDGRTSPMCQENDGKVYSMAEKEVGKNFPPLHPWCRSTIAPEIPGFVREGMRRWARDPNTGEQMHVPANMTYKEWRESIKPASDQSSALRGKIDNSLGAPRIRDFGELDNHVKTRYGVSLPDDVKTFTFDNVRDAIVGIDTVVDEFPEIKNVFTGFTTSKHGVMASDYSGKIHINPGYFNRSHDDLLKATINGHPQNIGISGVGSHEAGHLIERALIDKHGLGFYDWENGTVAKDIISRAAKDAKQLPEGKGKRNVDLIRGVSEYALQDRQETLAECVADYITNKEKSSPLSRSVWATLKKEFGL